MRRSSLQIALAALLAVGSAGCEGFLTGTKLTEDPNNPSSATRDQLFVGAQASMTTQLTGALARTACMFVQKCAGVDRQYQTIGLYNITEGDFAAEWDRIYTGGGLVDLRAVQASATADGDLVYAGVAKVLEALVMGTYTSLWGDIPYSEAVSAVAEPVFDPQQSIYAALQTLLDQAISDLGGAGSGPGAQDLIYGGDKAKWLEVAHTLKARYYLHTAERVGAAAYTAALAQANQGISAAANDFRTFHSALTSENNLWYQFQIVQRDSYLRVGARLVNLMNARSDLRLANYFAPLPGGGYGGANPGDQLDNALHSNFSATRLDPTYRQPVITWAEVLLIRAEAKYETGDLTGALADLNAERTSAGLPALVGITGTALRDSIMFEKYVATFQTIEAWNDFKRTCTPSLVPAPGSTQVIGRLLYGANERNANPKTPTPEPARNWNDPNPC